MIFPTVYFTYRDVKATRALKNILILIKKWTFHPLVALNVSSVQQAYIVVFHSKKMLVAQPGVRSWEQSFC